MAFNLTPWKKRSALPVRREESDPFLALQKEMNRLLEDFNQSFGMTAFDGEQKGIWSPVVNVSEDDKNVTVSAELPGLDEKDVEVSVSDNILTIRGEKKEEKEDKGKNYYRMERHYGSFQRDVVLPSEVEMDKADATFKRGVLTISLPKSKEAQKEVKKIEVKAR
ncbi:MAG TPA: Hsp20/alpha crystallin family protein [Planctomycetota bacterium]|nr:Hsp20/alpha crystallin family protein [Planctomycetota bacterium]